MIWTLVVVEECARVAKYSRSSKLLKPRCYTRALWHWILDRPKFHRKQWFDGNERTHGGTENRMHVHDSSTTPSDVHKSSQVAPPISSAALSVPLNTSINGTKSCCISDGPRIPDDDPVRVMLEALLSPNPPCTKSNGVPTSVNKKGVENTAREQESFVAKLELSGQSGFDKEKHTRNDSGCCSHSVGSND